MRVNLFTRSEREYVLLLVVHHIVLDYWSLAVLLDELRALYHTAQAAPAHSPASRTPVHGLHTLAGGDAGGPEGERLWAYWQKQLGGNLPTLDLPTDRLGHPCRLIAERHMLQAE